MWFGLSSIFLVACQVGQPTVDPDSESARLAKQAQQVDDHAKAINALAKELETNAALARTSLEKGQATSTEQVQKLQQLMQRIEEENAALRSEMDALETGLSGPK